MKAIPVWQPYASLIACGAKTIETRHWCATPPMIGERLAIYATKRSSELWRCLRAPYTSFLPAPDELPRGAIVATAIIVSSIEMTDDWIAELREFTPLELEFGHWAPGRWGWTLDHVQPVEPAVPFEWPVQGPAKHVHVPDGLLQARAA